jgi:hypothetical protein
MSPVKTASRCTGGAFCVRRVGFRTEKPKRQHLVRAVGLPVLIGEGWPARLHPFSGSLNGKPALPSDVPCRLSAGGG